VEEDETIKQQGVVINVVCQTTNIIIVALISDEYFSASIRPLSDR